MVDIMSTAMSIASATKTRDALEDAAAAESGVGAAPAYSMGKVYSFGSGDFGRLGHGDNLPHKTAKLVEILRDKDVRKITCGERHTVALTAEGSIYSWGYGGDGQLGHGDYQVQTLPALVTALRSEHIVDIACGDKHTAAITSGGDLYTWGENSRGQLGLGDFRKQHTPRRVMELQGKMVLQISCGAYHTACILDDETVYTWGAGAVGRLGLDHEQDTPVPTVVESLEGKNIQQVLCFAEHTIAVTVPANTASGGMFDSDSQTRLLQKVKELEVRRSRCPHHP